jgi:hypothetical protein
MSDRDLESGGGGGGGSVSNEAYSVAVSQASSLGTQIRSLQKQEKSASRTLDVMRRVTQVGIVVVLALLAIAYYFSPHPALGGGSPHKNPIFAAIVAVCVGYAIALQVTRGKFSVTLFMIMSGFGAFMFSLGYVVSELRRVP